MLQALGQPHRLNVDDFTTRFVHLFGRLRHERMGIELPVEGDVRGVFRQGNFDDDALGGTVRRESRGAAARVEELFGVYVRDDQLFLGRKPFGAPQHPAALDDQAVAAEYQVGRRFSVAG